AVSPRWTRFFVVFVSGTRMNSRYMPPAAGPQSAPSPFSLTETPPQCSASFQKCATGAGLVQSMVTQTSSMRERLHPTPSRSTARPRPHSGPTPLALLVRAPLGHLLLVLD